MNFLKFVDLVSLFGNKARGQDFGQNHVQGSETFSNANAGPWDENYQEWHQTTEEIRGGHGDCWGCRPPHRTTGRPAYHEVTPGIIYLQ